MLLAFIIMISAMSCNTEELFIEPVGEEVINLEDEEEVVEEDADPGVDASLPCEFDLNTIEPNSSIIINCVLDLGGSTINVPEGVTFLYEGGDIIDGTINFGNNGIISGELLNSTLTIEGSGPQLKDPVFNLDPARWGIVEGIITTPVAYNNKLIINETMRMVKTLGAKTIKIDALDAYFGVVPGRSKAEAHPQTSAVQVPSDIHLIMTDNTHLRTQPNNYKNSVLFTMFKADNSIVEGGFLHGDRDTHDYSGGSHEWGHLVLLKGSKNIVFKDVTLIDAGGDGIDINALGHSYDTFYTYCENVLVSGNKIIRARRNGLSITDGRNIIIENNEFIDSGVPTQFSGGAAPQWAIDVEAVRRKDGIGIDYEIAEHIIIRNNIERGSEKGGFLVHTGDYITFEGNQMESTIAVKGSVGSIVRNNRFENPTKNSVTGIILGIKDKRGYGNENNRDNQAYGNTIIGFDKGIFLEDPGVDLHSNTMLDCGIGIQILNSRDSKIRDNTIINEISNSEGISNKTSDYINNVDIYNNTITVMGSPFRFTDLNTGDEEIGFTITIRNNEGTSINGASSSFQRVRGVEYHDNIMHNSGFMISSSSLVNVVNNEFSNEPIRIMCCNSDLKFIGNTIVDACFWNNNDDDYAALNIVKENNSCE